MSDQLQMFQENNSKIDIITFGSPAKISVCWKEVGWGRKEVFLQKN